MNRLDAWRCSHRIVTLNLMEITVLKIETVMVEMKKCVTWAVALPVTFTGGVKS